MLLRNIFILFISMSILFSQTPTLSKGLGVAAGLLSGTGLSYRNVGENMGTQITFGIMSFPHYDDELYYRDVESGEYNSDWWIPDTTQIYHHYNYDGGEMYGNLGLMILKPLHRAEKSMFYMMGGASVYFDSWKSSYIEYKYTITSDSTYTYAPVTGEEKNESTFDYKLRFGVGIGLEYMLTENIRFSLDLPLTVSDEAEITMIVPEAALYYYFK